MKFRECVKLSTVAVFFTVFGCSRPPAQLAGRWVFLAQGDDIAVGQADIPEGGGPLHLVPGSPAAGACLSPAEFEQSFGPTCEHETEGGSPSAEAYVRWYCHGPVTVRVRFARCERAGQIRVAEVAVATVNVGR